MRASRSSARSRKAEEYRHLYSTARWRRTRADQLAREPLCRMCAAQSRTTAATVCDHVDPNSKLTEAGFFAGPFASLCDAEPWRCHSRAKQREERRGYSPEVGADGFPTDPRHRANRPTR